MSFVSLGALLFLSSALTSQTPVKIGTDKRTVTKTISLRRTDLPVPANLCRWVWDRPLVVDDSKAVFNADSEYYSIRLRLLGHQGKLDKSKVRLFVNAEIQSGKAGEFKLEDTRLFSASVLLQEGENQIVVQYEDVRSDSILVKFSAKRPNLHILSIGPTYRNNPVVESLEYTDDDAQAIVRIFESQQGWLFEKVHSSLLLGSSATGEAIGTMFSELHIDFIQPRDMLLVFISAHGMKWNKGLLILADNYRPGNEHYTAVDYEYILSQIDRLSCKKLIFIDACFSGAAKDNTDVSGLNEALETLSRKQNGLLTITSSRDDQKSHEHPSWGHGAFTRAILDGLNGRADQNGNKFITLNELFEYIRQAVPNMVREVKNKQQEPKLIKNGLEGDLPIFMRK